MSEGEPSHGDWDVVLEANQVFEAELAALRLREAGIEARVIDQSYRQEPLPLVRSFALVRVLVEAERARAGQLAAAPPRAAAARARRAAAAGAARRTSLAS